MQKLDIFRIETWDYVELDEFLQMHTDTHNIVEELMKIDNGEDPRDWGLELLALERQRIYAAARFGDEWSKRDRDVPSAGWEMVQIS